MAERKPRGRPPASHGTGEARRKAAAFRAAEAARERRRRATRWAGVVIGVVVLVAGVTIGVVETSHHGSGGSATSGAAATAGSTDDATSTLTGPTGPEGVPLEQGPVLASASGAANGETVDGIQCGTSEQVAYHVHTHLSVFVDGVLRPVPAGIGVVQPVPEQSANGVFVQASHCYYWLHTHAQDGIIHVEAPTKKTYTLGQFFAIWRQPLSSNQVGPARGPVTAYVSGRRYTGDPANIPLVSHEDVQLGLGSPTVVPKKIDWSQAQL